jgi:hypothetical protein
VSFFFLSVLVLALQVFQAWARLETKFSSADVCLGKPSQPERKLACDTQNKAKVPAMIYKLDRNANK